MEHVSSQMGNILSVCRRQSILNSIDKAMREDQGVVQ